MSTLIVTLPILPGKVEAWRRFCQELQGVRRADYQASRQRRGVVAVVFSPFLPYGLVGPQTYPYVLVGLTAIALVLSR